MAQIVFERVIPANGAYTDAAFSPLAPAAQLMDEALLRQCAAWMALSEKWDNAWYCQGGA